MQPDDPRTPSQIMGELLTGHPEAASLLAEASHRRALARNSAAAVRRAFAMAHGARLHYEELRHRLDPRARRTIGFAPGLAVLVLLGAGLTLLDVIELGGMWSTSGGPRRHRNMADRRLAGRGGQPERHWPLVIAGRRRGRAARPDAHVPARPGVPPGQASVP